MMTVARKHVFLFINMPLNTRTKKRLILKRFLREKIYVEERINTQNWIWMTNRIWSKIAISLGCVSTFIISMFISYRHIFLLFLFLSWSLLTNSHLINSSLFFILITRAVKWNTLHTKLSFAFKTLMQSH